jgi:hypothetical protein
VSAGSTPQGTTVAVAIEGIERRIVVVRGRRVMLDSDLADLYEVGTKVLVQAMKRNASRFPEDFAFRLSEEEYGSLRSQIVTSNADRGGRRYLPYAFTEQGVAMLSSVLRSERAIAVNIEIMRAFVAFRRAIEERDTLWRKLDELERRFESRLSEHDAQLEQVFSVLRELISPPAPRKRQVGFTPAESD